MYRTASDMIFKWTEAVSTMRSEARGCARRETKVAVHVTSSRSALVRMVVPNATSTFGGLLKMTWTLPVGGDIDDRLMSCVAPGRAKSGWQHDGSPRELRKVY